MALKEDAKRIFRELFGPEMAKQVDKFENPEIYPSDFLEECTYFLSKLIGTKAARKKLEPLYEKLERGKKPQRRG